MQHKIVITGGPGTGKSTVIEALSKNDFMCMPEISRDVTLNARKKGTDQLFSSKPLLFSELLLEGRINQFIEAEKRNADIVFFDRGIPDVHAYMDYFKIDYPESYIIKSKLYRYNQIFMMPPWEDIYISDSVRYESFKQALDIHEYLKKAYLSLDYIITEVPVGSIEERTDFILKAIQ